MGESTAETSDQSVRETEALESENCRLRNEFRKLKRIILALHEINVLSRAAVERCACNAWTERQTLDDKWIALGEALRETDQSNDDSVSEFEILSSTELFRRMLRDVNQDSEELGSSDAMVENRSRERRKRRGRPPKSSKECKPKRRLTQRKAENSLDAKKGKRVTQEGKEMFLSRTKRLRCQWPGCDAMFR